jgi:hypothetical protein
MNALTARTAPISLDVLEDLIEKARTQQAQLRNDLYAISIRPDAGNYQHASGMIQGHLDGLTDHLDVLIKLSMDAGAARDKDLADRASDRFEASLAERKERLIFDETF